MCKQSTEQRASKINKLYSSSQKGYFGTDLLCLRSNKSKEKLYCMYIIKLAIYTNKQHARETDSYKLYGFLALTPEPLCSLVSL